MNKKCPRCGSDKVQLSSERSKNGCLWFLLFGVLYIGYVIIRWIIGTIIFILYDWWMSLVRRGQGLGYIWQSKKWFSLNKRVFYCHNCSNNFRS